jgi:serine/threonine protein kinase
LAPTKFFPHWAPEAWARSTGRAILAWDAKWRSRFCLRVLHPIPSAYAASSRKRELQLRSIIPIFSPCSTSAARTIPPYIVSELLEGETLRARLITGPLPVRKAVDYALQVARGLAAAHDHGIFHRDLKPENIFITRDGHVKILDFGLAKLTMPEPAASGISAQATLDSVTGRGVLLGTLGYMSPEQCRGATIDARSDIFSFGAVLYEMISGQRAFRGDTTADTISSILKEEPPDLATTGRRPISANLNSLCWSVLQLPKSPFWITSGLPTNRK